MLLRNGVILEMWIIQTNVLYHAHDVALLPHSLWLLPFQEYKHIYPWYTGIWIFSHYKQLRTIKMETQPTWGLIENSDDYLLKNIQRMDLH